MCEPAPWAKHANSHLPHEQHTMTCSDNSCDIRLPLPLLAVTVLQSLHVGLVSIPTPLARHGTLGPASSPVPLPHPAQSHSPSESLPPSTTARRSCTLRINSTMAGWLRPMVASRSVRPLPAQPHTPLWYGHVASLGQKDCGRHCLNRISTARVTEARGECQSVHARSSGRDSNSLHIRSTAGCMIQVRADTYLEVLRLHPPCAA
jgi:hypothetical protein